MFACPDDSATTTKLVASSSSSLSEDFMFGVSDTSLPSLSSDPFSFEETPQVRHTYKTQTHYTHTHTTHWPFYV